MLLRNISIEQDISAIMEIQKMVYPFSLHESKEVFRSEESSLKK
jgi:hypothetical protein